jgi:hypothetical protein
MVTSSQPKQIINHAFLMSMSQSVILVAMLCQVYSIAGVGLRTRDQAQWSRYILFPRLNTRTSFLWCSLLKRFDNILPLCFELLRVCVIHLEHRLAVRTWINHSAMECLRVVIHHRQNQVDIQTNPSHVLDGPRARGAVSKLEMVTKENVRCCLP